MTDLERALTPPPFSVAIDCFGETHWIEVVDGVPRVRSHGEKERALIVLGAKPPPCMQATFLFERAPAQLAAADNIFSQHGNFTSPAAVAALARRVRGEPVDATAVPQTIRRLAALQLIRKEVSSHKRPNDFLSMHIRKAFRYHENALEDIVVSVGELVSFERGRASGGPAVLVTVPPRWLATVYLWGVEMWDREHILSTEPSGRMLRVQLLRRAPLEIVDKLIPAPQAVRMDVDERA